MNLQEMTSQFTGLMNRRDLTANTALVSTFMAKGILRAQRDLRVPAMEKKVEVTIPNDFTGALTIPNDLMELKEIRQQADLKRKLNKVSLNAAYVAQSTLGIPQVYSRDVNTWVIGPTPAAGDKLNVTYYAEFTPLVNPTDENVASIIAWDLIVAAACKEAADWFTDKRMDKFEANYQQILQQFQDQADQDELGDNTAVAPGLYYPQEDCE